MPSLFPTEVLTSSGSKGNSQSMWVLQSQDTPKAIVGKDSKKHKKRVIVNDSFLLSILFLIKGLKVHWFFELHWRIRVVWQFLFRLE